MSSIQRIFDSNEDLFVERYYGGIRLVQSDSRDDPVKNSLSNLFHLSIPMVFMDEKSRFVTGNHEMVNLVGGISAQDIIDKNAKDFWTRDASTQFLANDQRVLHTESLQIFEETGTRLDDFHLQSLSLKCPWYYQDKIAGVFICSLPVDSGSLDRFAQNLSELISIGLLSPSQNMPFSIRNKIHLTPRENDVLHYLTQGYTAKGIALILNISRRTVEHNIENIKSKTNCHSKSELIQKYHKRKI